MSRRFLLLASLFVELPGCAPVLPPDPIEPCPVVEPPIVEPSASAPAPLPPPVAPKLEPATDEELMTCSFGCELGVVTDRVKIALETMRDHHKVPIRLPGDLSAERLASLQKLPWLTELSNRPQTERCEQLGCVATPVRSLEPLRGLDLRSVGIIDTEVRDIGALMGMSNLSNVTLDEKISSEQVTELQQRRPKIHVYQQRR